MTVEEHLAILGLELPIAPVPKGAYLPAIRTGNLVYTSGSGSNINGVRLYTGKVGSEVNLLQAQQSARLAVLNNLANIKALLGSLEHIRVIKLTGFVNSAENFNQQAKVIDGASLLLEELLGENGKHARSAIGVYQLPFDLSVEIEMVVEVDADLA